MEEECRRSEQLGVTMRFLLGLRREKHIFGLGLPSDPVDPVEQVEHMYLWRLIASDPRIKEYVNAITENIKLNDLSKQGVLVDPLVVGVDLAAKNRVVPQPGYFSARLRSSAIRRSPRLTAPCGEGVDYSLDLQAALRLAGEFMPKVRFGHALGFARHIDVRGYERSKQVIERLQLLMDRGLCLEVNLTSNQLPSRH